jgi:RND family efflux transporter MFP subunit
MNKSKVLKKSLTVLISIILLGLVLAWMSGAFREKIQPGAVAPELRLAGNAPTDVVHRIVETETAQAVGTLVAAQRTEISSKVVSSIRAIRVRARDRVKKGDVLVELDDRDMQARLEQARQAAIAAQAELENAEAELARYRELQGQNVISAQEFDQKQTRQKVAQAQLDQARQAVAEAEASRSDAVIRAPVDGVVVDKLAEAGDMAVTGKPLLVIYDPEVFRLEAAVPESLSTGLEVGGKLNVRLDVLKLEVEGTIDEIVPQSEAASRSTLIKVRVPRDARMVEGMFGRVAIPARERVRLCVPLSAVRQSGQLRFADVVDVQGRLQRRMLKLGEHSEYGRVELLSGLEAGERVVLHGPPPPPFPQTLLTTQTAVRP